MFHRVSSPSKRVLQRKSLFYTGKHEVDRRSRLVTLKYKGYCWSGCYTVAESVGQQSFNSALGIGPRYSVCSRGHGARMRDIWPQWSGRSLRAIPGRRVAERRPRPSPRLPRPRGFGGRSVHPVVRHAADPTRDTGGGEPPYDCCGASRRWFIVRGGQCHYPELD